MVITISVFGQQKYSKWLCYEKKGQKVEHKNPVDKFTNINVGLLKCVPKSKRGQNLKHAVVKSNHQYHTGKID